MAYDFVKISMLPLAPQALSGPDEVAVVQAGTTYRVPSRSFVLPTDPLVTFANVQGDLPGSRRLVAGVGISLQVSLTEVVISTSSAGSMVIFDQTVQGSFSGTQNDWNPTGWDGAVGKSRLEATPDAASLLTGLDATAAVDGQMVALLNESATNMLRLAHQAAGSVPANRFWCPGGATFSLAPYQCCFIMNQGINGWRIFS